MQLVLERHAAFFHRLLVEGGKADGVDLAALHRVQAGGQGQAGAPAGGHGDLRRHDVGLRNRVQFQEHRAFAAPRLVPVTDGCDWGCRARDVLALGPNPRIADQHDVCRGQRLGTGQQFGHQLRANAAGIAEGHGHNRFVHHFTGREAA